jgi:hypothetical protein
MELLTIKQPVAWPAWLTLTVTWACGDYSVSQLKKTSHVSALFAAIKLIDLWDISKTSITTVLTSH